MSRKLVLFMAAFILFCLFPAGICGLSRPAFSNEMEPPRGGPPPPPPHMGHPGGKALERIQLTEEQKVQVQKIRSRYEWQIEDIRISSHKARLQMADYLREENPARKKVDEQLHRIMDLERQRQKILLDEFFETREILNPEQRRQLTMMTVRMILRGR